MPFPVGQLRQFYNGLKSAPSLKGITVLLGARHMAKSGAAPRIVLFPKGGPITGRALRNTQNIGGVTVAGNGAIRDVERVVIAHLWAKDGTNTDGHFDAMEDLYNRFFQALDYQAVGGLSSSQSVTPGLFWSAYEESWDVTEDTAKDGEEVYIALQARIAINPAAGTTGTVQSTSMSNLSTTLSTQLGSTDTTASVVSTAGFPNTGGLLSIDAEQIQYQGIVGNQFIGLVRGVNGTTAATHSQGVTVNVS